MYKNMHIFHFCIYAHHLYNHSFRQDISVQKLNTMFLSLTCRHNVCREVNSQVFCDCVLPTNQLHMYIVIFARHVEAYGVMQVGKYSRTSYGQDGLGI